MLKKWKIRSLNILQILIIELLAVIVAVCGLIAFSISIPTTNTTNLIATTLVLVLSVWDIIFVILNLSSFSWIWSEKNFKNICRERVNLKSYTFQLTIGVLVTTILLSIFIILALIL